MGAMGLVGALLFFGIVGVTISGWRSVPQEARFPVSIGVPPSLQGTVGKRTGLIAFLSIGVWFFAGTWFAASEC